MRFSLSVDGRVLVHVSNGLYFRNIRKFFEQENAEETEIARGGR